MPALMLDQENNSTKNTQLTRHSPGKIQVATMVLFATDPHSFGVRAYGTGHGAGVFGANIDANSEAKGVLGTSDGGGVGVHGQCYDEPAKRKGMKEHGVGVYGRGPDFGVHGDGDYAGVSGISKRSGVEGHSKTEAGVYGHSYEGVGVEGSSGKGDAGRFYGDVYISGDLYLQGAKSAVVPFPDGSHRRLYCQESPESWFEDFGEAKLVKGRAVVKVDKGFGAVTTGTSHVFLTPLGDCNGLFVRSRRRGAFEVRELGGGDRTLLFSFRIVARRKDVASPRFGKVRIPKPTSPSVMPKMSNSRPIGRARTNRP